MQRSVGCWFDLEVAARTDVTLSVAVASGAPLFTEAMTVSLDAMPVVVEELADAHGGRLHVARELGPGTLRVAYEATVDGAAAPPPTTALDLIRNTRPSRYCEVDVLVRFARDQFQPATGKQLVDDVRTWVHDHVAYISGSSRATDGAVSTLLSRQGVCRDFTHLVITLLRACDVPARFVSVYAPGLSPMDFHAVAEAYVDGAWVVVDATGLAPRSTMLRIATGLDAADTAFITTSGDFATMGGLEVGAVTDGPLPYDDPHLPVQLH